MSDLAAFLTARFDEDETTARAVVGHQLFDGTGILVMQLHGGGSRSVTLPSHVATYAVRFDPARVLAEVAAKRALVAALEGNVRYHDTDDRGVSAARDALELCLRHLAAPYAEHPDFKTEWRITP